MVLDIRASSGYHIIPIEESDRDKTAFITYRWCFRYKVLPFGCTTALSMDLALCGLTYSTCLVYLDDFILCAGIFETHLMRVLEVFDRLRAASLKLFIFFRYKGAVIGNLYGPGTGPIWLDDVRCEDGDTSIANCRHKGWGTHNCGHHKDVSVSCGSSPVQYG